MKKVISYSFIFVALFSYSKSRAQVHVDVNIGRPVYVAPAPVRVSYYYLPDVEAYYYVPQKVYYYRNRGQWISGRCLPGYREYNVYNVKHIAINEHRPYLRHDYYRSRYNNYYVSSGRHDHRPGKWKHSHTHRGRGRR